MEDTLVITSRPDSKVKIVNLELNKKHKLVILKITFFLITLFFIERQ